MHLTLIEVGVFWLNMCIVYRWSAPGLTKPTFEEAMQQKFRSAKKVGGSWEISLRGMDSNFC